MIYNLPQIASFFADMAGVAALILSIYVFVVNRRDHMPRLSIGIDREELEDSSNDYDSPPLDVIFVNIANPSERRIKVVSIMIEWSVRKGMLRTRRQADYYPDFQTKEKVPFLLVPGDNASYAVEADDLMSWLANAKHVTGKVSVRAIVSDATGNLFTSRWLLLNVVNWYKTRK